ncbi:hypothetical protein PHYPO_G00161620 [Pangasianodon hypophthalmus]|uniref:Uncharacterized protein n=1 Tax=Pangasianodon hypophthalmus TaxID=310915 RepID=A0A5N5JYB0_PANHP|nr:hypothetical protein PHYPO_G00161620 [Pangasianodon hypophthalmus]
MIFQKFLLLILVGVFASSLVIVVLFVIISMCIRRKAAKYAAMSVNHTKSSYEMNSFKHVGEEDIRPPLPPRTQLDTQSMTNSYEEVPENPTLADETSSLQEPVISQPPETQISFQDNISASESYDDVDQLQNAPRSYEDVVSLPDYLEVDPSPLQNESDNGSENYDDVDQLHEDNEDYDDVG